MKRILITGLLVFIATTTFISTKAAHDVVKKTQNRHAVIERVRRP